MKATLLKVTGETVEISPVNGTCFTLKEAQNLVNGCVQVIDICPDKIMIMNEECKFRFELNVEATRLALMNRAIFSDDYIAVSDRSTPSINIAYSSLSLQSKQRLWYIGH